ncbi:MAG: hypothetical protein ACLFR6_06075 [Salinarchaeum sp.]
MSEPTPDEEELIVEEEGVTVTKTFVPDDLPVPAIRFLIVSTRETPVVVTLQDTIPRTFSMNSVGFHPEYGANNWTAHQDHRVVYERELAPAEDVETVYGIRIDKPEQAVPFMTSPELTVRLPTTASATGTDPGSPLAAPEDAQAAKELLAADADDSATTSVAATTENTAAEQSSIVAQLIEEIEAGGLGASERQALREALNIEEPTDVETRISHLQSRIEEVAAHQTSMREDLGRLEGADETAGEADIEAIEIELQALVDRVDALENATDQHSEYELSDLEARLEAATDRLDAIEDDVATLRDDVDAIQRWRNRLGDLFS